MSGMQLCFFWSTGRFKSCERQRSVILTMIPDLRICAVAPAYQNYGIGSSLVKHAVERADKEQANSFLQATESPAAVRCYEKNGFRTIIERNVPGEGHELEGKVPKTRVPAMVRKREQLSAH